MPGSGKTATVLAAVRGLKSNTSGKRVDMSTETSTTSTTAAAATSTTTPIEFEYVEINCLRIRKPDDACETIQCIILYLMTKLRDL